MKIARIKDAMHGVCYAAQQDDGSLLRMDGSPFEGICNLTQDTVEAAKWLAPLEPTVIMCIGANYLKHAQESGKDAPEYPILFMKNLSAATGHLQPIHIPAVCDDEVDFEAELAVVIGKPARNVSKAEALNYVFGYTVANDVSARKWQALLGGSQWCRGKGFDTFAPMGPVLVTADEIPDPNVLTIRTELNGQELQNSNTSDMIFDVPTLINFLSQDTTLLPGTVILTGTPEGIGWARDPKVLLNPGDKISVEIEGIGILTNPVAGA